MREETAAEKEGGLGGRFDEGKRGGKDQCKEKKITLVVEKGGKMAKGSEEERRKRRKGTGKSVIASFRPFLLPSVPFQFVY